MELIKIESNDVDGEVTRTVDARDLHSFLEVPTRFNDWITNRIKQFDFEESVDYLTLTENLVNGGRQLDYHLTIDMAKELSMVERNTQGKKARQYFIQCEKIANEVIGGPLLPKDLPAALRALADAEERKEELRLEMVKAQPKIEFHDRVRASPGTLDMNQFAKVLKVGRNKLFRWCREQGFLMRDNQPYQRYMDMGWFRVIEQIITVHEVDEVKIKTLILGKGQVELEKRGAASCDPG